MNPAVIIKLAQEAWANRDKYGKFKAWQNARRRKRMAKKGLGPHGEPLPEVKEEREA